MYDEGNGVPENNKTAVMWYTKAAEQGNASAQTSLGNMYKHGIGVPENDKTGVMWYTKAAEQGFAGAQFNLGLGYVTGEGIRESYIQAYIWWSSAKANGYELPKRNLEKLKKRMTKGQIAKAQELAAKCYASDYKDCN
jgi:TPR repeat protein